LPHTYNDTKISKLKKTKAPLTHKPENEGAGHLVPELDMLGSIPSSRRGIYIAGEEEVTGFHGRHGPVELKSTYSYELSLVDWVVVCILPFYFCGWVPFFYFHDAFLWAMFAYATSRPHQRLQLIAEASCLTRMDRPKLLGGHINQTKRPVWGNH